MVYFAARHRQHEHLVLNSLDVTFTNSMEGGFGFRLTRRADDGLPPTAYNGKGQVQCTIMPISLAVWAMDPFSGRPLSCCRRRRRWFLSLPELAVWSSGVGAATLCDG